MEGETFIDQLEKKQIKLLMTGDGVFRAVLHREVSKEQVQTVIETIRSILAKRWDLMEFDSFKDSFIMSMYF